MSKGLELLLVEGELFVTIPVKQCMQEAYFMCKVVDEAAVNVAQS